MSRFVFSIDSAVWRAQEPDYLYPVTNTDESFSDLLTTYETIDEITTVTISWSSYINNSNIDGIIFDETQSYFNHPSINIQTPASELNEIFTSEQVIRIPYNVIELKYANFQVNELITKFTIEEILKAGYNARELFQKIEIQKTYKNVLLIDATVIDTQTFIDSCNEDTLPILYDNNTDRNEILDLLKNQIQIERLGLVFHNSSNYIFLNNESIFETGELNSNTQFLIDVITKYNITNIDFLACETLSNSYWKELYDVLLEKTGVEVGASNDNTGNIKYGGDWILESTNTDIEFIYFTQAIEYYRYLLLSVPYSYTFLNNNIYIFNRVWSSSVTTLTSVYTIPIGKTVKSISYVGGDNNTEYTIYLMTDGTIYGFGPTNLGPNYYGQLGIGTSYFNGVNTYNQCEFILPTGKIVDSVIGASNYILILMTDGTIYGRGLNIIGQLGTGSAFHSTGTFTEMINTTGKTPASISCGSHSSIVLMTDGTIYGCGNNAQGQLGDGTTINRSSLVQMINTTEKTPASITCGWNNNTIILMTDGTIYICGYISVGYTSASLVKMTLPFGKIPSKINVSESKIIVLMTDGTIYVWTDNYIGSYSSSLYNILNSTGKTIDFINNGSGNLLISMTDGTIYNYSSNSFTKLENISGKKPKLINTGGHQIVILMTDNSVYGLGNNYSQEILPERIISAKLKIPENKTVLHTEYGINQIMIITTDGKIYCSLSTYFNISTDDISLLNYSFVECPNTTGKIPKMSSIGYYATAVLMTDGTIYQIGDTFLFETRATSLYQLSNTTGKTPTAISCGQFFIMVLMTDGTIWGGGHNYFGELGDGTTIGKNSLVQMINTTGKTPFSISCGWSDTIVLMTDGTIYGCGNFNGSVTLRNVTNTTGKTPSKISCGQNYCMILMTDGTICGYGYNNNGQLGDGTTSKRTIITQMINTTGKIPIDCNANYTYTTVTMSDGSIYTCGNNTLTLTESLTIKPVIMAPALLKPQGYRAIVLRECKFTASELKIANYTISELKDGNYTALELKDAGYTINEIKNAGYIINELKAANYTVSQLVSTGYTLSEIKSAGYTGFQLRLEGYSVSDLKTVGYSASQIQTAGYSASELINAGYIGIEYKSDSLSGISYIYKNNKLYLYNTIIENTTLLNNVIIPPGKTINSIFPGEGRLMILTTDGNVYGCGNNSYGQLGNGTTSNTENFTKMINTTMKIPISIKCVGNSTILLMIDGTIWGCGSNENGQLGDGTVTHRRTLVQMINTTGKIPLSIEYAFFHTLILMTDGTIYGCGLNTTGQLGDGTVTQRTTLVKMVNTTGKTPSNICLGIYHTVVLMTDGTIYGCGQNTNGQLGDGTTINRTTLIPMINATGKIPSSIKSMNYYTMILMTDGTIYGCGQNTNGQLGDGSTTQRTTLVQMTNSTGKIPTSIDCGNTHTMVLMTDGTIYGCGNNSNGRLGDGTGTHRTTLVQMTNTTRNTPIQINCAANNTFVKMSNGTIYSCGDNTYNQLGLGLFKVILDIPIGKTYSSSIVKNGFIIILMTDGTIYGYGTNNYGQLGNGTTIATTTFVQMTSIPIGKIPSALYGGSNFTIVKMTDGTIYGCGLNTSGQLGNGTTVNSSILVQLTSIPVGKTPDSIVCGNSYMIILMTDKTIYGCGLNTTGQLGNGTTIVNNPILVEMTSIPIGKIPYSISCGDSNTMILMTDGTIYGCGYNKGQLGNGTTINSSVLVQLKNITGQIPLAIYSGYYNTLIQMMDGSIYGCGDNAYRMLGDGTSTVRTTLIKIISPVTVNRVICSDYTTTLLTTNRTFYGCGNYYSNDINNKLIQNTNIESIISTAERIEEGYTIFQFRLLDYSALDLKNIGYSLNELISIGCSLYELRIAGYTASELLVKGYTTTNILSAGYSLSALFTSGFSITDLSGAFPRSQIATAGYTPGTYYQNGFSILDLSGAIPRSQIAAAGYSLLELYNNGFTPTDLSGTFTNQEIVQSGYSAQTLFSNGFSPFDLSGTFTQQQIASAGYPASTLRTAGYSSIVLNNAQYTSNQLQVGGYSVYDLSGVYTKQQIELAGYLASTLREAGYTPIDLVEEYSKDELLRAGYSASTLFTSGYTVIDLSGVYTQNQIAQAGYSLSTLYTNNIAPISLTGVFPIPQIVQAGYTAATLAYNNFTPTDLSGTFTTQQIVQAGYPAPTLYNSGFTILDLSGTFTPNTIAKAGYPLATLYETGFTPTDLSGAFTTQQIVNAGYPATILYTSNFTPTDLSGAFTSQEIAKVGYSLTTLYDSGFTPLDLSGSFLTQEIVAAGYSAPALSDSGFKPQDLIGVFTTEEIVTAGYEPSILYETGYSITDLSGTFTSNEIAQAGYSLTILYETGFTPTDLSGAFAPQEIAKVGYSLTTLYDSGFTPLDLSGSFLTQEIVAAGYSAPALSDSGFKPQDLIGVFTTEEIVTAGYEPSILYETGYSITDLSGTFTSNEIAQAGYSLTILYETGFTPTDLSGAFAPQEIAQAGYPLTTLYDSGFTPLDLSGAFPKAEILSLGFPATELFEGGFQISEIISIFTTEQIVSAGYAPTTLFETGFTITDLSGTFTSNEIAQAGYPLTTLYDTGFTPTDLSGAFTTQEIVAAGYQPTTLYDNGFAPLDLSGTFTTEEIVTAGYAPTTLSDSGFTPLDLINVFTTQEIVTAGYAPTTLFETGFTITDLSGTFTPNEIAKAGYSITTLYDNNLTPTDLSGAFTTQEIVTIGYSASTLYSNGFSTTDLSNNFTTQQIVEAGYSTQTLFSNGFSPFDLSGTFTQDVIASLGYTASVLYNAGYPTSVLNNAQYTSNQLQLAGYSVYDLSGVYTRQQIELAGYLANTLREAGYTPIDLVEEYSKDALLHAGYTSATLFTAGYTITDLSGIYTPYEISIAGYSATDLKTAGYSASQLNTAGFTASQIKVAGYILVDALNGNYSISDINTAGYTVPEKPVGPIIDYLSSSLSKTNYIYRNSKLYVYSGTSLVLNTSLKNIILPTGKTVKSISCGQQYTIILMIDGTIYSCGDNSYGQLGNGTMNTSVSLTQIVVPVGKIPSSVTCGHNHSMVLMTDGTVYGCGYNGDGRLGNGTTSNSSTLVQMINNTGKTIVSIGVGNANHTILLMTDGTVYGCGNNVHGALGDGTTTNRTLLTQLINSTGKTPKSLFCGGNNTIILMTDGTVYGCGNNIVGQFGIGSSSQTNTSLKQMTSIPGGKQINTISCGKYFTIILMTDGTIYGCGENSGALGDGTTTNRSSLVKMINTSGKTPKAICSNDYTTIVLMTDGSIYGTGWNYDGQIGDGTTTNRTLLTQMINSSGKIPVNLINGYNFSIITMSDGTIYGCGNNAIGQFGAPFKCIIDIPIIKTYKSSVSGSGNIMVLMTDGTIYGCGSNNAGQLGDGTTTNSTSLVQMINTTGKIPTSISCGDTHTLVLMTDGTVYGCGNNIKGALGDGTVINKLTLVKVIIPNGKLAFSIICGYNHSIIMMTDETIYGCGYNAEGQLGDGTTIQRTSLVQMINTTGKIPQTIICGYAHTSILMTDGTIYGTGQNTNSQLGDGTIINKLSLVQMINTTGKIPKIMKCGYSHTMILMTDGTIYGCGSNSYGELGDGTIINKSTITQITNSIGKIPTSINCSDFNTMILMTDGTQYGTGANTNSQLGNNTLINSSTFIKNTQIDSIIIDTYLKEQGYKAIHLRSFGFTASDLKTINYTASELNNGGYNLIELKTAGYTSTELINTGYVMLSISELKLAGYSASDLYKAYYSIYDLSGIFTTVQIASAGYSTKQLYEANYSASDLKSVGFTALQLKIVNYTINQIIDASYSAINMYNANYSITELIPYYNISDIITAGFTNTQFFEVNISASDLRTNGKTALELKTVGYSLSQLVTGNYTTTNLKAVNYTAADLNIYYTLAELISAPYIASDLRILNYTITDQITNGYQLIDLSNAGYIRADFESTAITIEQLKTAGYKSTNYTAIGYSMLDIYNSGFYTIDELIQNGYMINAIFNTGISIPGLIFDLSAGVFNNSIPVRNTSNSFTGLTVYTSTNTINTTVNIRWTSYSNKDQYDGFRINTATYYENKSFDILQFGGIPLANPTGVSQYSDAAFQNFKGSIIAIDTPSIVNNNLNNCFLNSTTSKYGNLSNWDVSGVVNIGGMFANNINFNVDISGWNVSNVTSMDSLFYNAFKFNQPIGNWNVSNVTKMYAMFFGTRAFNQPIGNWNVSNVTNMAHMFNGSAFNQPIENWNVSKVTNIYSMFYGSAFNQDISGWNISNVTSLQEMFRNNIVFNQPIGKWDVSKVTSMYYMFTGAASFNQDISGWNVSKVTSMQEMFNGARSFSQQIGKWDFTSVNNYNIFLYNTNFSPIEMNKFLVAFNSNTTIKNLPMGSLPNYAINSGITAILTSLATKIYGFVMAGTNVSVSNFNSSLYTLSYVLSAAYTLSDLKTSQYKKQDYIGVSITIQQLKTAGYTSKKLKTIDYTLSELLENNVFSLSEMRSTGYKKSEYTTLSITVTDLKNVGFTQSDLADAGYSISEAYSVGYLLTDLSNSGFQVENYTSTGISIGNLKVAGYKSTNYKAAGYTLLDLEKSGIYTRAELLNIGYTYAELISGGIKYTGLIFDISSSVWNSLTDTVTRVPVKNTGGSFTNLQSTFYPNVTTGLTTVFVTWSRYYNLHSDDGLSFSYGGISNNNTYSVNLLQYDGITLANSYAFLNFKGTITAIDTPVIDSNNNLAYAFKYTSCKSFGNLNAWDVSKVKYMNNCFEYSNMNQDISSWNVSNVTNLSAMFHASTFSQPIGNWNVSSCTNFQGMFQSSHFNQDITKWKFSKDTISVDHMIYYTPYFNQNIGIWDFTNMNSIHDSWADKYASINTLFSKFITTGHNPVNASGYNPLKISVLLISLCNNTTFRERQLGLSPQNRLPIGKLTVGTQWYLATPLVSSLLAIAIEKQHFSITPGPIVPNISTFKSSGYSAGDLRIVGYTIPDLITTAKYNLIDLSNSAFQQSEYTAASYTINNLITAGYSIENLVSAGYSLSSIQTLVPLSSFTPFNLLNTGYTKSYLQTKYTPISLKSAGFSITNFIATGYTVVDIISAGYSLYEVKKYGFTKTNYIAVGYTIQYLKQNGFTKTDYTNAGYSPLELLNSTAYSLSDLTNMGYTNADLIPSGCIVTPGFIFELPTSIFNNTTYIWKTGTVHPKIPILPNCFVDLSYSFVTDTYLTTVYVTWSSHITGKDGFIGFYNFNGDKSKINILQWGGIPITNNSAMYAFSGKILAVDVPIIKTTNFDFMFRSTLTTLWGNIGNWDVSGVTSFSGTFRESVFNADISNWNVSNATIMSDMFGLGYNRQCIFNQDISNWNVSKVTHFNNMFQNTLKFNQPIGKWNMSSATNLSGMFQNSVSFNQDISEWNTANVTTIENIFNGITGAVPNIGGWNYTKIKNVNNFVTTPLYNTPNRLLAITALFRALSNNSTYCLGTDPALPLLDIPSLSDIVAKLAEKGYILVPTPVAVSIADFKAANVPVADLRDVGFTIAQLLSDSSSYNLIDISGGGYTQTEYVDAGVSVSELLTAGYSPTQLVTTGFSVASLSLSQLINSAGFDYKFKALGYTISQVIADGNSLSIFVNSDYISSDYIQANISVSNLFNAGFTGSKLLAIGFQPSDLTNANLPVVALIPTSMTISQILASNNYSLIDLSNGNYTKTQFTTNNITLTSLKTAEYPATTLITAGYTVTELYQSGFTVTQLLTGGVSTSLLYEAGATATEMLAAGVTVSQLLLAGYSATSLKQVNVSLSSLISAGYVLIDLSNAGFTIAQMKTAGVTLDTFIQNRISITVLKESGFTSTNFKDIGVSSIQLGTAGYTLPELTVAGYSASTLLSDGYTVGQLKANGFTSTQLSEASVSLQTLYDISFGLPDLVTAGFSLPSLKSVGFSATDFYNASYSATITYGLSFTIPQMRTAGYTAGQMLDANINASLLKINDYTALDFKTSSSLSIVQLNILGYTSYEMRAAGYSATELLYNNVYTPTQLKVGFYPAVDLKVANVTASDMKIAGYSASQLYSIGYTTSELYSSGYTVQQLFVAGSLVPDLKTISAPLSDILDAGYSLQLIYNAGYNATELATLNYTASQLKAVGYSSTQLRVANYTSVQLFNAAYNATDLFEGGYSATELKTAGYTAFQGRQAGFILSQLKTAYYTIPQLKQANYTSTELKDASFTATELNGYYSAIEMKVAGFTTENLFVGGYSATDVLNANYSVVDMKTAGYSVTELKTAGASAQQTYNAGFTTTQLKSAGYTATELSKIGITISQLFTLGYTATETTLAKFSIGELYSVGYTVPQLKEADYTIVQMKTIGISDANILAAGFTVEELLAAGMQFNLDRFSTSNTMSESATALDGVSIEGLKNFDATAVFYMSQEEVQKVFTIKLQGELIDLSSDIITYFTHMDKWPQSLVINPSNAMLNKEGSTGAVFQTNTQTKMLVKHDFIRYLALNLFGSVQGVDLFNNESSMIQALNNMGTTTFQQDISGVLWNYSSTNPNPQLNTTYIYDSSLNIYGTTNDLTTNDNICRELCQQLLFENIDRFSLLSKNSDGLYPIPILAGDSISFTYTIFPSSGQHLLTGVNPIVDRTYKIVIIIDDGTGKNTIPVD